MHLQSNAIQELLPNYVSRLVGLARKRLDHRLRAKIDPEDIVQSVFRSLLTKEPSPGWIHDSTEELWRLLALLTIRKCLRKAEHFHAQKRDLRKELDPAELDPNWAEACLTFLDQRREPSPEETTLYLEATQRLLENCSRDLDRRVVELSLQGYSVREISDQIGHYERGVERIRKNARNFLLGEIEEEKRGDG